MSTSLYLAFGEPVMRELYPGTVRTTAVETLDNDHAYFELQQLAPGSTDNRPPKPGTRITEVVETIDEQLGFMPPM
jgi:hypothetical protein